MANILSSLVVSFVLLNNLVTANPGKFHFKSVKELTRSVVNDPSCHCSCQPFYVDLEAELRQLVNSMKPRQVDVSVYSEACNDPTVEEDTCGSSSIKVDGKDYSLHTRGHNVVVLNRDGTVLQARAFDTWDSSDACEELNEFLLNIPLHKIVLIAVEDSTSEDIELAFPGLQDVGADTSDVNIKEFRSSWALIGYKGQTQPWQYQASTPRYRGPTYIGVRISLPAEVCTLV